MADVVLDPLAARLQADLRLRFPDITVRFVQDDDGFWVCRVDDGAERWGELGEWVADDEEPTQGQAEQFLAELTINVSDYLWPDALIDPWPLCPRHGDHPLHPRYAAGRAVWECRRDPAVVVSIGALDHQLRVSDDDSGAEQACQRPIS